MGGPSDSSGWENDSPAWGRFKQDQLSKITDPEWNAKFSKAEDIQQWNAMMKEYQSFADKQNAGVSGLQQEAKTGFYQQGRKSTVLTPGQMDLGVTTPGVVSDTDFVKALQGYYNGKKLP